MFSVIDFDFVLYSILYSVVVRVHMYIRKRKKKNKKKQTLETKVLEGQGSYYDAKI